MNINVFFCVEVEYADNTVTSTPLIKYKKCQNFGTVPGPVWLAAGLREICRVAAGNSREAAVLEVDIHGVHHVELLVVDGVHLVVVQHVLLVLAVTLPFLPLAAPVLGALTFFAMAKMAMGVGFVAPPVLVALSLMSVLTALLGVLVR